MLTTLGWVDAQLSCWDFPVLCKETTESEQPILGMFYWYTSQTVLPSKLTHHRCLANVLKKAHSVNGSMWAWWMLAPGHKLFVASCQNSVSHGAWGKLGLGSRLALTWVRHLCPKGAWEILRCLSSVCGNVLGTCYVRFLTLPLSTLWTLVGRKRSDGSCQWTMLESGAICFLWGMHQWAWMSRNLLSQASWLENEAFVLLLLERATPPGCNCLSPCVSARKPFCLVVAPFPFESSY